jgi:pilus assembly protein Flp/PilA
MTVVEDKGVKGGALFRMIKDDRGVTALEYAFIAALIATVIVAAITQIGIEVTAPFSKIAGTL